MGHWDLRVEMQWHHLRKTSFVHTSFFFLFLYTHSMCRVRIPTELWTLSQFVNGREKTYYLNKCDIFFSQTFLRVGFVLSDLATASTWVKNGRHSYSSLLQLLYFFFSFYFLVQRNCNFSYTLRCSSHPSTGNDISYLVCSFAWLEELYNAIFPPKRNSREK